MPETNENEGVPTLEKDNRLSKLHAQRRKTIKLIGSSLVFFSTIRPISDEPTNKVASSIVHIHFLRVPAKKVILLMVGNEQQN